MIPLEGETLEQQKIRAELALINAQIDKTLAEAEATKAQTAINIADAAKR